MNGAEMHFSNLRSTLMNCTGNLITTLAVIAKELKRANDLKDAELRLVHGIDTSDIS